MDREKWLSTSRPVTFHAAGADGKRYSTLGADFCAAGAAGAAARPAMTGWLLHGLGWLLAHAPEAAVRAAAALGGTAFYHVVPRRRRLLLSNLHHAFPERPAAWHRATARACLCRFAETGLLALATPHLSTARLRRIVRAAPSVETWLADYRRAPHPVIFGTPHFAYWEMLTAIPLFVPPPPEIAAIYRPLDHPALDAYVRASRERFGVRLLSRREGFQEALRVLRRRGAVGILYDQNAGDQGALTLLLDRVCSTTELAGLLAQKTGAALVGLHARRLGFWRIELQLTPVATDGTAGGATLALNRWLESLLRADPDLSASWLWGHQRWKTQDQPRRRFRLEHKRNLLDADLRARGLTALPRRTRIWVRLPNWLGDVVMALPLLRALRAGRPDAEITLLARPPFVPLLEALGVADRVRALPPRGPGYFPAFWRWRDEHPDTVVLLTNSFRGDLEAWLLGSPQRFGLVRPGRPRPLLTHRWRVPVDFREAAHHQIELWRRFLDHFGLAVPPDCTAFAPTTTDAAPPASAPIGLIVGSENMPAKRWPAEHWRALVAALPDARFRLFGTAADQPLAARLAQGQEARVENLAGRTTLPEFAASLRGCRLLVTNDTGGMHLANALGVPVIALFGPTNPVRTGPVFAAPVTVLQPPDCPPEGGGRLGELAPATVAAAVRAVLAAASAR